MSFLPVLLFALGIIVLIIAWQLGNPRSTSPELLAALKGIAGVKRDIGYIRSELQETGARLEEQEGRIEERKTLGLKVEQQPDQFWQPNQALQSELLKALEQNVVQEPIPNLSEDVTKNVAKDVAKEVGLEQAFVEEKAHTLRSAPQVLSDKYRGVIELHNQGWSTLEIAGHLAISQDAVNMVLKTYPRGGQR